MAVSLIATHNAIGKVAFADVRNFVSKAGKALTKTIIRLDTGIEFELPVFGDKRASYPVGTAVSYGIAKSYGRWDVAGPSVPGLPDAGGSGGVPTAAAPSGARPAASSGGASRGSFPIKGDDYQTSIIRQNSLTNAVNLVNGILGDLTHEPITFEEATRRADAASDLAIRVAYKFASFSSGHLDIRAAQDIANKALNETAE